MSASFGPGDRLRVKADHGIRGVVLRVDYDTAEVTILDADSEFASPDDELTYKFSEVEHLPTYDMVSPNGDEIIGTFESIRGHAKIGRCEGRDKDGKLIFDWEGETVIWWDEQRTIEEDGERLFVDANYNLWKESEVELEEVN